MSPLDGRSSSMNLSKTIILAALALGCFAGPTPTASASSPAPGHMSWGPKIATNSEFLALTNWIDDGKVMAVSGNWLIGGQAGSGAKKEFLAACIEADGTVSTSQTLEYRSNLKRWAITCPNGAEVVTSDKSKFFARSKAGVKSRGSLHPLTATYVRNGQRRILCLASMPNEQSIPGFMDVPARGQIPSECKIKFGGNLVGVKDWRVFEGLTSTAMSKYNTWWAAGSSMPPNATLPLFTQTISGNQLLCSGIDRASGKGHPGVVSGGKCLISANFWTVQHTNEPKQIVSDAFFLYLAQRNPAATWSSAGTVVPSDALDFNKVNNRSSAEVFACRRSPTGKLGYIGGRRNPECKIPGSTETGPFQVLIVPGSGRG